MNRAEAPGRIVNFRTPLVAFLILGLGLLAGSTGDQIPLAFAVAIMGAFLGLLFIKMRSRQADVHFLCTIFLLGISLRCVIALVNHYLLPHGTFALDDGRYNQVGRQLVAYWQGEGSYPGYIAHTNQVGWFYVNAAIYWLWGFVPLVPAFLNCLIGPFTAVYVFYLCQEVFDRKTGVRAALLAMFFPSLMLWSSINLKDALTVFSIIMILWYALTLQRTPSLRRFAMLLGFLVLLGTLRSYLFVLAGVSIAGSFAIARIGMSIKGLILAALMLISSLALYQQYGFGSDVLEADGLQTLSELRLELGEGGSAYGLEDGLNSPMKAIAYLPKGLAYFLLAPAPWQIFNLRQALTFPEMLIWYCLLPAVWRGMRYALRHHSQAAVTLLCFVGLITVAYALVETNLGTAYRHRAQVLVVYLIFAGVGLAHRRRHVGEKSLTIGDDSTRMPERAPAEAGALP